jgi:uncharacterized protein involved in exopolysaccharide biosynthesis
MYQFDPLIVVALASVLGLIAIGVLIIMVWEMIHSRIKN